MLCFIFCFTTHGHLRSATDSSLSNRFGHVDLRSNNSTLLPPGSRNDTRSILNETSGNLTFDHSNVSFEGTKESRLNAHLKSCGETCDLSKPGVEGKYFDQITKTIDCATIFDPPPPSWTIHPPPTINQIPDGLLADYSMNGAVPVNNRYLNNYNMNVVNYTWQKKWINGLVENGRKGRYDMIQPSYGAAHAKHVHELFQRHRAMIEGRHCAVVGTKQPWVEVLLLEVGAAKVTTIEYARIISHHERISWMHPNDLKQLVNQMPKQAGEKHFDCVVSYSSLEHSGLGRYGDPLDPWGDVRMMAQMQCVTKPLAAFFVGYPYGREQVCWNSHRIYGPHRSAHMFANIPVEDADDVVRASTKEFNTTCNAGYDHVMFYGLYKPGQFNATTSALNTSTH